MIALLSSSGIMASLRFAILRDVRAVQRLRSMPAGKGRSAEAEHREILRQALAKTTRWLGRLAAIPATDQGKNHSPQDPHREDATPMKDAVADSTSPLKWVIGEIQRWRGSGPY